MCPWGLVFNAYACTVNNSTLNCTASDSTIVELRVTDEALDDKQDLEHVEFFLTHRIESDLQKQGCPVTLAPPTSFLEDATSERSFESQDLFDKIANWTKDDGDNDDGDDRSISDKIGDFFSGKSSSATTVRISLQHAGAFIALLAALTM